MVETKSMNMPKISIIVPMFNSARFLDRCVRSLRNQTLQDIEIICVNDGSTDNSMIIVRKFANNDSRIKIIEQQNKKQGAARNAGMKIATGEYIGFVDSDDWVDLDLYKLLLKNIQSTQSDIAICGIKNEFNNYMCTEERYVYSHPNIISNYVALNILSRCENNNYI